MTQPSVDRSSRPSNFFDVLRLVAAAMVVVGHSWSLLGIPGVPMLGGITIHHLGVYIFFSISGYLLSVSWARSPRPGAFMIRRCLRIFPALMLVVLVTVFIAGPLLTSLPAAAYWGSGQTWQYLLNMTLFAQYDLPGLFLENDQRAVNGSLWSLGPEFCCYLMVMLLGVVGARFSFAARAVLMVGLLGATILLPIERPLRITAIAVVFFLAGSLLAKVRAPERLPLWPALAGLAAMLFMGGDLGLLVASVIVPYGVVAAGSRTSRMARAVRRAGDPSYGMYLWAFPIQQTVIVLWGPLPLFWNIVVVLALSAAAGYASWHLLEKHAIAVGGVLSARVRAAQPA
ncbi:MAG: acyltransferase [Microthrixaceae bacterium]|nr:acyltransferase [Microthrixaceae bacterium]